MIVPSAGDLNYFTIRGVRSPGRCRVSGADRTLRWNEAEGHGYIATLRLNGIKLAHFTIAVDMWTPAQLAAWELFVQVLPPPEVVYGNPAGIAKMPLSGVDIGHPVLAANGITKAVLETIGQLTRADNGIWTSELKFIEWQRPVALPVGKVNRTIPGTKGTPPAAQTEADKALAEGTADFEKKKAAANGAAP